MNITIEGYIVDIFPVETIGNFSKRVVWVEERDVQYPNTYSIEFAGRDISVPDAFVPGDKVKVQVNLQGRKWEKNGKSGCMNTLRGWRMDRVGTGQVPSNRQKTGRADEPTQNNTPELGRQVDDDNEPLPF